MFRPGNLGHLGRLGLVAASQPSLVTQALAILAKYGSAANLYLPGVGAISGITAGNWLDSIGTTSATVDNPVGLVVSAGKDVGPELLVNGDFSSGLTGWNNLSSGTGSASVINSQAVLTGVDASNRGRISSNSFTTVIGRSYRLTWTVISGTANSQVTVSGGITLYDKFGATVPGSYSAVFVAAATSTGVSCNVFGNGTVIFDNFSIRELPGAHLTQSTAANRPVLRQSAGSVYAWQFDGSNDRFDTQLSTVNSGWICVGAKLNASAVGSGLYANGSSSGTDVGIWFRVPNTANFVTLLVSNGTTREILSTPTVSNFVGVSNVFSAGWSADLMLCALNNAEVSQSKTVDCTTSKLCTFGGFASAGWYSNGDFYPLIVMSVLPTATERATLRQFIASLSGVAM